MECMSNFTIVFLQKLNIKRVLEIKTSKPYIKGALPLNRKRHKTKKIKTLTTTKMFS